jgi:hypothetical protein
MVSRQGVGLTAAQQRGQSRTLAYGVSGGDLVSDEEADVDGGPEDEQKDRSGDRELDKRLRSFPP